MTGKQLVEKAAEAKQTLGGNRRNKFSGAATVEILREALTAEGIKVSRRDVFVKGVGIEVDLLISRGRETPLFGLLYDPKDVAVVLEVKNAGSFGEQSMAKIKKDFESLKNACVEACAYVAFEEARSAKWAATEALIGAPCYTLVWCGKKADGSPEPADGWNGLLDFLREQLAKVR